MPDYTFVDLFAGAGGFSEGLLLSGEGTNRFRLVAASDIHDNARLTHEHRFRDQLHLTYSFLREDIRSDTYGEELVSLVEQQTALASVDVIVGGPPCQGFSVFGLRREQDPRNDLFLHYLRTVEMLGPKYFVLENVPGMEMMYDGKTVRRIYEEVAKLGPIKYGITGPIKVNAADFGVPQLRERVIFIGHREDMLPIRSIPRTHPGPHITVAEALGDLAFLNTWESNGTYHEDYPPTTTYQLESRTGRLFPRFGLAPTDNHLRNHEAARHTPLVIARFAMIEQGKGLESIPRSVWEAHLKSSKKWCVRLHPNKPSFTVVTMPDDLIHYARHRILTIREMARLQSFDDTFEFLGPRSSGGGGKGNKKRNQELPQYTQVGNAIPPLLAKGIGNVLLNALEEQSGGNLIHHALSSRLYQPV